MSSEEVVESASGLVLLQPGQRIKPNVSPKVAERLIDEQFEFQVTRIKELNSYDDNNYYVEAVNSRNEPERKFVFKILNSMDSKRTGHIEAENECMLFLCSKGINCPIPQLTKNGKTFSVVTVPAEETHSDAENNVLPETVHAIRLLSFVEGNILSNIPLTKQLLFDAGSFLGILGNHLKNFSHKALENHSSVWQLQYLLSLREFMFVIKNDMAHFNMVESILDDFANRVAPELPNLEKGVIHGDFNEQNILVQENPSTIHGVIDFGDIHISYYVFELAIHLCYMMLECVKVDGLDPIEGVGVTLAGYLQHRQIPNLEFQLLRTCICGRLCQSLVMGAYTYSQDEGNTYLLTTASRGWKLLHTLWNETTDEQLLRRWNNVIENYK